MKSIVFDIEADSLEPTKIWCIAAVDPDSGEMLKTLTVEDGVEGPDDLAFAADGSYFWTSILTGEVAGFTPDGYKVVAAQLTPGVNPITFSDDGRLSSLSASLAQDSSK